MLRNSFDSAAYKYCWQLNTGIIYSNCENIPLKIDLQKCKINDFNDEIIKALLDERTLKFIVGQYTVNCIALVGSHSLGLDDKYSDYDFCVIVDEDVFLDCKKDYYIIINDIGIHWYIIGKNLLIQNITTNTITLELNRYTQLAMNKFILIKNMVFTEYLQSILPSLCTKANICIYNRLKDRLIETAIQENDLLVKTKLWYYLCIASHMIEKTAFNKAFLLELKQIKYNQVSKNCIEYCLNRIQILKNKVKEQEKC